MYFFLGHSIFFSLQSQSTTKHEVSKILQCAFYKLLRSGLKIAGRKRPALVDPSHKVRQGGKGSVWDGTVITLGSKATNSPPQEQGV